MSSRRDQYKDAQKHGGDIDGSRRRQREAATSLRKDKRHAQLARKRMRDVLNLGGNIEKRDSVSDIDIPQLVKHMSQFNSTEECLNAVRQLRESTGVNQNIIDSLLQCEGAVDTLRQLLAVSNSSIQLEGEFVV
ncbi:hypothetical protein SARC_04187 [Sphaeroforma arctica JP610]|uniref:IBB domain-containing protein n=1 Tax=Sphaeroforma arctica JP610 TaxID=667725 RepID=A0A0L0G5S1_9EUKA|nr:hypothetical protein SARC_04187 [Sphaeroforma arctica JP610]KNC83563.1 hypothetical protein SARC_04187 [Sphaeroforma arctica JP610]|eukprot:XP_014157465.1 hypothetical protein SARC_04187 [Sphaeroforma arctica JP610]